MAAGEGQRCGSNLNILLATFQEAIELNLFGPLEKHWQIIIIIQTNDCPSPQNQKLKQAYLSLDLREHKISLSRSAIDCAEQSHCRSGTQVERFGRCWRCLAPALVHQKTNVIKHPHVVLVQAS